ncbi:MAG: hypothetical protein GX175_01335 [Halanaerobiaceae bacterium]|nr:hypothetical protein [Halanaerobiaceae bacterium]
MSRVIKSSQINGEYKLSEETYYREKAQTIKEETELRIEKAEISQEEKYNDERIKEAEKRALEIIKKAELEAEEIRKRAQEFQKEVEEEAFNKGYQEGLERGIDDGSKKGLEELREVIKDFEEIILTTEKELDNSVEKLNQELISLAVKISRKLINTEIRINPEIINDIVKGILKEMFDIEKVVIYLSPELLQYISREDFINGNSRNRIEFLADSRLKPGDCIVETKFGCKDGTIEEQLARMEKELLKGAGFYEED